MWSGKTIGPWRLAPRAAVLAALALGLTGCGFQPLHGRGPGQVASESLQQVRINPIADRSGQILRGLLMDRLQPQGATAARYALDVGLNEGIAELAKRADATSTYSRLILTGSMRLTDLQTGKPVLAEPVRSEIGYINQEGGYGTLLAQNEARERAVQDLANSISLRLAAFLAQRGQAQP